jgi:hypothetical protein
MGTTGRFSISHDTLARFVFLPEFLTQNPSFDFMRDDIERCRSAYQEEVKKKGCSCRVDNSWAAPCLSLLLTTLERANKTDHETVRKFIRFVGRKSDDVDVDGLGVNIIYGDKTYTIFLDHTPVEVAAQ